MLQKNPESDSENTLKQNEDGTIDLALIEMDETQPPKQLSNHNNGSNQQSFLLDDTTTQNNKKKKNHQKLSVSNTETPKDKLSVEMAINEEKNDGSNENISKSPPPINVQMFENNNIEMISNEIDIDDIDQQIDSFDDPSQRYFRLFLLIASFAVAFAHGM